MPATFDLPLLRRRVKIHELNDRGYSPQQISEQVGLPVLKVSKFLKRPKPKLADQKNLWWVENAACAGENLNLFYPEIRGNHSASAKRAAMQICNRCPVRKRCREVAESNYEQHGVWGGFDFSRLSYCYDEKTGQVRVRVRQGDGTFTKIG